MNLILQQLSEPLRGNVRAKLLLPEAARALNTLQQDAGGLIYKDMWRCATSSLMAKRVHKGAHLPGYSSHNFGLAVSIDVEEILNEKKITYEDLLYLMKKRGWYCHRRDGAKDQPGSGHFNFLGDDPDKYLSRATLDPMSWDRPAELRIYELYGTDFSLSPPQVQSLLKALGFFHGEVNGHIDLYSREAIMAFQRAWDLVPDGVPNITLQRVLTFVSADIQVQVG
jgi:hypothetical protein